MLGFSSTKVQLVKDIGDNQLTENPLLEPLLTICSSNSSFFSCWHDFTKNHLEFQSTLWNMRSKRAPLKPLPAHHLCSSHLHLGLWIFCLIPLNLLICLTSNPELLHLSINPARLSPFQWSPSAPYCHLNFRAHALHWGFTRDHEIQKATTIAPITLRVRAKENIDSLLHKYC